MQKVLTLFLFFFIFGCDHPESRNFSRDNNSNEKIISKSFEDELNNKLDMELENGVRYVWIEVNGIRLRFIFDTGASNICISSIEASVLYRQGTLQKEDILDKEYFQDATGRISEGTKVNLRTVKIGSITLENIEATVVDNVNAPLLLGQSVLENFGKIEIDNDKGQIIFK
jgi:aspartyl protease family protein